MIRVRSLNTRYNIETQEQIDTINSLVAIHLMGWRKDGNNWIDEDDEITAAYGSYTPLTDIAQAMELLQILTFTRNLHAIIRFAGEHAAWVRFNAEVSAMALEPCPTVEGLAAAITITCLKLHGYDITEIIG